MRKNISVIIPSWKDFEPDMEAETGAKNPLNVILKGMQLYQVIAEKYKRKDVYIRMHYVVNSKFKLNKIKKLEENDNIKFYKLDRSDSILASVKHAIRYIDENDYLIINMADTIIDIDDYNGDIIYTDEKEDVFRWTTLEKTENNEIKIKNDRIFSSVCQLGKEKVFAGVMQITDIKKFKQSISEIELENKKVDTEKLFIVIERYSQKKQIELRQTKNWLDFGSIDTYHESKLRFINLRHFNELIYNKENGTITKKSKAEGYIHQVRWFKQVPDSIKTYLPKIYEINDGYNPSITMELLGSPTLSEYANTQKLSIGLWNTVADGVVRFLSLLDQNSIKSKLTKNIKKEIYINKTLERIKEFLHQNPDAYKFFIRKKKKVINIEYVLNSIEKLLEKSKVLEDDRLVPIHGDLCFSNIIFEPRTRMIKVIDPRGIFGIPGIYGDRNYDLAKLMHSYSGGYDKIISKQYSLEITLEFELKLTIFENDYDNKITEIFNAKLAKLYELNETKIIESILFISMLPLHSDDEERQKALLARGLILFSELEDN